MSKLLASVSLTKVRTCTTLVFITLVLAGCAGSAAGVNSGNAKTNVALQGFMNGFFAVFGGIARKLGFSYRAYLNKGDNPNYDLFFSLGILVFVLVVGSLIWGSRSARSRRRSKI
jgi:hypothetical protein